MRGRGIWPAAPSGPTRFAGPMKQHSQCDYLPQSLSGGEGEQILFWLIFPCIIPLLAEGGGLEPASPPCKDGALPAELWPQIQAVWSDDRLGCHRGKYRMTRWENCGRSGGDRTRDHLLPKQVRCLCATLRYGRQPDADGPGHDGNLFAWLPHKPSRPQSRQRPEVGRGRCRSGEGKEKPGLRLPQGRAS